MTEQPRSTAYVDALAERFDCPLQPFRNQVTIAVDDRQLVHIRFGTTEATVATPVAGAHDGLPDSIKRDLLRGNFPNNATAGAMLRRREYQDYLELVNVLPYAAFTPEVFAAIAAKQAEAARKLSERVARLSSEILATETAGGQ
jgi:hypothetical protein